MAKSKIFTDKQSLGKVISGIKENASLVAKTYGYTGHDVCIKYNGRNYISNDGVTVSNNIIFEDELKDLGSSLVRNITLNSDLVSNDGTTASAILSKAIIEELEKYLLIPRYRKKITNWLDVKAGMQDAVNEVVKLLTANKKNIKIKEKDLYNVAYTATRDETLSKILCSVFLKIGKDGRVLFKEQEGNSIDVEYKNGFNIDVGYSTTLLPNVLIEPKILVYDERINSSEIMKLIIGKVVQECQSKNLVIFAKDGVSELVMQQLIQIQQSPQIDLNINVVSITGTDNTTSKIIEDIAKVTGADIMNNGTITNLLPKNFGSSKNVNINHKQTTIVGGNSRDKDFQKHLEDLEKKFNNNRNDDEKEQIQKRIANLKGQVAIIKIGGLSRERIENYKDKIKDAIGSMKNAIDNGVVAGGGTALLDIYRRLHLIDYTEGSQEFQIGYKIIVNSLKAPFNQILKNSYETKIPRDFYRIKYNGYGYNAKTRMITEHLFTEGIIDPYNTVVNSLKNALDICSLFVNLDGFILVQSEVLSNE